MPAESVILANHSGHAGFGAIRANIPITTSHKEILISRDERIWGNTFSITGVGHYSRMEEIFLTACMCPSENGGIETNGI